MLHTLSAQVDEAGGSFRLTERELADPGPGQVRVTVQACGVCRSDSYFVNAGFPVDFPLVTGHEIAGRIESTGEGVDSWAVGDRVAVGWFGGNCATCRFCREGDFIHCEVLQVPGWAYPGGYAEATVVPATALARIPDELAPADAAPMGCAGVATFNALRHSPARPGDLVAVLGLGGLGHLGVQFANKMGLEVVVVARGDDKADLATSLGAHHYIDSTTEVVTDRLKALGGARTVLATAANSAAMTGVIDGLRPGGELLVLGATPEPIEVSPFQVISTTKGLHGHPSGTAADVEDTLRFAALTGVRPITETVSIEEVQSAYDRMLSGEARFRMVLTTGR